MSKIINKISLEEFITDTLTDTVKRFKEDMKEDYSEVPLELRPVELPETIYLVEVLDKDLDLFELSVNILTSLAEQYNNKYNIIDSHQEFIDEEDLYMFSLNPEYNMEIVLYKGGSVKRKEILDILKVPLFKCVHDIKLVIGG